MRRYNGGPGKASAKDFDPSERYTIERPIAYRSTYLNGTHGSWSLGQWRYELPWSEVSDVPWSAVSPDKSGGWIVPSLMQWGDYGGSTVERANYEAWCEDFASVERRDDGRPNWLRIYGGHDSHGIAIALSFLLTEEGRDAWEALAALQDYPLMSDDSHSALEMRLEEEAWSDFGWSDLQRELSKRAEEEERADLSDAFDSDALPWSHVLSDAVFDQTWDGTRYVSELHAAYSHHAPHCETATSCWLPIDRWVEDLTVPYLETLVTSARDMVRTWTEQGTHACIGCKRGADQERLFPRTMDLASHHPACEFRGDVYAPCKCCGRVDAGLIAGEPYCDACAARFWERVHASKPGIVAAEEVPRGTDRDLCPMCGEDRNHPSQHGGHSCTRVGAGKGGAA